MIYLHIFVTQDQVLNGLNVPNHIGKLSSRVCMERVISLIAH